MIPMVIQNWYPATIAPRTFFGATSDIYRMIMAETNPTPKPATRRPTTSRASPLEMVWRMTPMVKIPQPAMIVVRRPMKSARSPAIIAPKKVPAERIEVIKDFFQDERMKTFSLPWNSLETGWKCSMTYGMAMTPLMYPESYPKNIPPNALKAHMRYAFMVTGASIRAVSAVAARAPGMMGGFIL